MTETTDSPTDDGDRLTVAYLTTFYNGDIDGRFGRFHDWIHAIQSIKDPPFDVEIVALTSVNHCGELVSDPHAFLGNGDELWGSPWNNAEFVLNVPRSIRDLRRTDYDVLHVLTLDTIAFPLASMFGGNRLVIGPDIQGYFPGRLGDRWSTTGTANKIQRARFHLRRWLRKLAPNARVVALSEYHRSNIEKLGVDPEAIKVLPPGVDPNFCPPEGPESDVFSSPVEFLFVGDLSRYKGYPMFLKALAGMATDKPWRASIVGRGDPDVELVDELGIDNRVAHEGFVPRSDLPEFYRAADFFVMPSIDENGPNTIVEALACGTPVLATDRPGINEYGDDTCCLYFERTVQGLRTALETAIQRRSQLRSGAIAYARSHSIEETIEALAELYRETLRSR